MNTIWKFPLEMQSVQEIPMPARAVPLCVQVQQDVPCIWAQVNSEATTTIRQVTMVGTGHEYDQGVGNYLGTFQWKGLVFHVYVWP